MLRKITMKKMIITTIALFSFLLIYIMPAKKELNIEEQLIYVDKNINVHPIFLLDKNGYVSLTNIEVTNTNVKELINELMLDLIKGKNENVPSDFKAILPPNTRILSIKYDKEKRMAKVNFSKEILDISKDYEEKMIEMITYTLTSIKEIDRIIIYVEGEVLTKLPKTKINLPSTLDRGFGINKEYEFTNLNNIMDVTVYYINQNNGNYYYVPVTKYLNDDRDRANIVIEQLSSSNYSENLKSYLRHEAKLEKFLLKDNILNLDFNDYILDNEIEKTISEEVQQTIILSMRDNYDINEVVFTVKDKPLCKSKI